MTQEEAIQSIEETYRLNKYHLRYINKKNKRIFVGQAVWDAIQHTGKTKKGPTVKKWGKVGKGLPHKDFINI